MAPGTIADFAKAFSAGWSLIRQNVTLTLPVLVFVALEHVLSSQGAAGSIQLDAEALASNMISVLRESLDGRYMVVAAVLVAVKSAGVYFTNADMYRALSGKKGGTRQTVRIISWRGAINYLGFTFIWYVFFGGVGIGISLAAYGVADDVRLANLLLVAVFLLLFPLFYAGLSIFAFLDVAIRAGETVKPVAVALVGKCYVFYMIRSVLDFSFVILLPLGVAVMDVGFAAKLALMLICLSAFVAYMRSVAVNFKYECLLVRGGGG